MKHKPTKRILALLLSVCMILTMTPSMAFAAAQEEPADPAQPAVETAGSEEEAPEVVEAMPMKASNAEQLISEPVPASETSITDAESLAEALAPEGDSYSEEKVNVSGNTVTLMENCKIETTEKRPVITSGEITLDLNGKSFEKGGLPDNTALLRVDGGNVTIRGAQITGKGGLILASGGSVTLDGVKVSAEATSAGNVPAVAAESSAELTITGGTIDAVNNAVGVFGNAQVTISGGSKITSTNSFGVGTNGSKTQSGASITISDATIKGDANSNAGVYLPGGTLTVENGANITGAAGVVVRGGKLDVQGGTITATGNDEITVGDAGTTVPSAGIAVDKKANYNNGQNEVTVSGGTVKAASNQPSVSYTENGKGNVEPDGKSNKIEISDGTFLSGKIGDTSANAFVDGNDVIGADGTIVAYENEVIGFGYGATRQEAIEALREAVGSGKNINGATADWGDQVMFIYFKNPIPHNKEVKFTVKNEYYTYTDSCKGSEGDKDNLFAWSFLNKTQTPYVAAMPGDWSLTFDNENIKISDDSATVPVLDDEDAVHFATLTQGNGLTEENECMTVTPKSSSSVGQYYEVRFDTQKLPKTNSNGNGEEYWLGWALQAPSDAKSIDVAKAANAAGVIGGGVPKQLEQKVVGDEPGYALYYKANDPGTGAAWVRVTWKDESGKDCGTTFIHVVFGDITFKPDNGKEITVEDSGFEANGDEAFDENSNALWAEFKLVPFPSSTTNYTARVKKSGTDWSENATLSSVDGSYLCYCSITKGLEEQGGGKYIIELLKGGLPVANAVVEVYEVKYKAGSGVESFEVPSVFTDIDDLDAVKAAKPNVTLSSGKSKLEWEEEVSEDGYVITLTANGTNVASNPGGSTTPQPSTTVNKTTPVNGKFTISDESAKAGETVKVDPSADEGYVVDQVTVTDKSGREVPVTKNEDGTYSFTMPETAAQPVNVSVTFKKEKEEEGEVTPPPVTEGNLVFSSENQADAIKNRITTDADTALKLKAADEGVDIGDLTKWDVTSDNEAVVEVLRPSNMLHYVGVGTANITVKANGSDGKVYSIVIPISVELGTPTFTLSHVSSKKARTFTVTTSTVRGATGFQVKYSLKKSLKSSKTKTYECGKKLNRQTIKANKSKRTYYVRVRAYIIDEDGNITTGAWSKLTKKVKSK